MGNRLIRFMSGRYGLYSRGLDTLNKFLSYAVLAIWIITFIPSFIRITAVRITVLTLKAIGLALLCIVIYRFLSKNIARRQAENMKFIRLKANAVSFFKHERKAKDKLHKIYKCPNCKAKVRVPRGKGKIRITCPKCKTAFIKRT